MQFMADRRNHNTDAILIDEIDEQGYGQGTKDDQQVFLRKDVGLVEDCSFGLFLAAFHTESIVEEKNTHSTQDFILLHTDDVNAKFVSQGPLIGTLESVADGPTCTRTIPGQLQKLSMSLILES
jgi:hypothetical protein